MRVRITSLLQQLADDHYAGLHAEAPVEGCPGCKTEAEKKDKKS